MNKFDAHILVVDDDEGIRNLVKQYLNENNYLLIHLLTIFTTSHTEVLCCLSCFGCLMLLVLFETEIGRERKMGRTSYFLKQALATNDCMYVFMCVLVCMYLFLYMYLFTTYEHFLISM